jgi:ABC-2 type transport system permease protein
MLLFYYFCLALQLYSPLPLPHLLWHFPPYFIQAKMPLMVAVAVFLIFALPAFLGTTVKKVGFGKIINSISPLSGAKNIMNDMFINKLSMSHILIDALPIFVFAILALISLRFATGKLTLLGGE